MIFHAFNVYSIEVHNNDVVKFIKKSNKIDVPALNLFLGFIKLLTNIFCNLAVQQQ